MHISDSDYVCYATWYLGGHIHPHNRQKSKLKPKIMKLQMPQFGERFSRADGNRCELLAYFLMGRK